MPKNRHFGAGSDTIQQVHDAGVKSNDFVTIDAHQIRLLFPTHTPDTHQLLLTNFIWVLLCNRAGKVYLLPTCRATRAPL